MSTRLLLVIAAILGACSICAADSACKPTSDAKAKILSIPVHMYMTDAGAGKPRSTEMIYLNNTMYIQVAGAWRSRPISDQARKEAQVLDPNTTCRVVRDEAVNRESATVYGLHRQTADAKSDSQMWISKSRGVPLKLEMDTDVGGTAGKSHRTIRYEYANVQAPAGAH
jgi:outer membrane lipoprotein-sorting protein